MSRASWFSVAIVLIVVLIAVLDRVGLVDIVSPGSDNDSNTTSSPSGLETIERDITMLRGCSDSQVLEWDENNDIWVCTTVTTVVTLLDPGGDAQSTTVNAPSGMEIISSTLTLLQGCSDAQSLSWDEANDFWECAPAGSYTDAEAIAAVEGEATLQLAGAVNIATTLGVTGSTTFGGNWRITDDLLAQWGTDSDVVAVLNSAGLASDEELTGVIVGTSVYDTAVPPNSLVFSNITVDGDIVFFANTGGNSIEFARIDASTRQFLFPRFSSASAPTVAFGDGDYGLYSSTNDFLNWTANGSARLTFTTSGVRGITAGSAALLNEGASATNPSLNPDRSDSDTGIGQAASNELSMIAGAVEGIRIIATGDIDLTPAANTDASAAPIIIQNVSQNDTPGTTTDGQIRLWEDANAGGGASDGRILYQINGTTYQLNADAGITFTNNPLALARDKALFAAGHAQWKLDRLDEADIDFLAFRAAHPEFEELDRMEPEFSKAYLDHLTTAYAFADAVLNPPDIATQIDIPYVPTLEQLRAQNPWPDPLTYTIPDPGVNETQSPRTGTDFVVGDTLVLSVDRLKFNQAAGENVGVHTVPALLKDEFLHLLRTDTQFLNDVKALLGLP